ncbi:beta-lactamase family protein [Myxococcus sp. XM-1-1-1]|uniref:serine hydrolase domain-containing protein n=1 Tax=Myxococcus sp. XM-1-1-1 TaxID=2874602 RepID=UPI001CBD4F0E|nr:serine hydrolase domain-containing protein [Myxococcus sp. XM-1-1-1]MBZ4409941.1 beta-lactamase family protein [Myxococcus sp. XM-1-1-1]
MNPMTRWTCFLGLLLLGCASSNPGPERCTGERTYRGPTRRSAPESVWPKLAAQRSLTGALDAGLTQALDTALDSVLKHVPAASVAVALPGEGLWTATRGVARTDTREAVGPDSLFQVASVTKSFTAVLVSQLAREGRLSLDAPVSTWFPQVQGAESMTVADLLEHTHGLVSFNALPGFEDGPHHAPEELIQVAAEHPRQFCPGTNWAYSNTGYVMLGRILEQVEGKPFADLLQERIAGPLGLTHSRMRTVDAPLPQVVSGHLAGAPITQVDYATPYAAGSLASRAEDLVRFWHALMSGALLPMDTVQRMFQDMHSMDVMYPPSQPGNTMSYGRGVQLYEVPQGPGLMLGHSGGIQGFTSVMAWLPEDDAFVAVIFNDNQVAAEAGLWALVRALREHRSARP